MIPRPRPPIVLDAVLADPGLVRELVTANAPYWSVQRYFANPTELASFSDAASRSGGDRPGIVAPWFRGDWAYDKPLIEGVEPFLFNPRFTEAAKKVLSGSVVRPQMVYVNANLPMPVLDPGHTDVPAFRGIDRTRYPIWLLATMLRSGLFERWRVPLVTAVSWFYDGEGGGFTYWPDGPDAPPVSRPCQSNTALVGDNDVMFHRVEAVGADATLMRGLTLDSQLTWSGDAWAVTRHLRDGEERQCSRRSLHEHDQDHHPAHGNPRHGARKGRWRRLVSRRPRRCRAGLCLRATAPGAVTA